MRKTESVAMVQKSGPRQPKTTMSRNATVVTHTETYGANVVGTSDFSLVSTWALQPGLSTYSRGSPLGQWLPQIAQNFDNYEIESLKFKFRTACSTLTTGLVVFGFEPNPEGTAPTTYQELRNMYSVDGSAHANLVFDVSNKVKRRLLIRKTTVNNLPSYDAGRVYMATIGVNDSSLVGFVDVEYRIRLINPQSATTSNEPAALIAIKPTAMQRWSCTFAGDAECASQATACYNALLANCSNAGAPLAIVVQGTNQAIDDNLELAEYYGIDTNKGYGAKKHIEGIKEHGITIWHRRSFGICKDYA